MHLIGRAFVEGLMQEELDCYDKDITLNTGSVRAVKVTHKGFL